MKKTLFAASIAMLMASSAMAQSLGVSMALFDDNFLTVLRNGMIKHAEDQGVALQIEDAQNDGGRQLNQIQNFIASGVDAVIVNPVDTDATVAMSQAAAQAGLPLVYVNREPVNVDQLPQNQAFVASDERESGTLQTQEVCRLLREQGVEEAKIVVMMGELSNQAARMRTQDIHDVIATDECAFMTIDQASAEETIRRYGLEVRTFESGDELIASAEVDAVLVTSWGPTHEPFVLAAIAAGKPVFSEKPLATTARGALDIVEAETRAGRRLVQVGFMRRYDAGYRALKQVVDAGTIGLPLILHCAHRNPTVPERYTTDMAINDTVIHELDVLRWLLDDDYVSAQIVYPRRSSKAFAHLADPQIVLLETAKGARIDIEVFVNCQYGYDIQCEVVGEAGIARLFEPATVPMRREARLSTAILTDWKDRFIASYDVELQDFLDAAREGTAAGPTAWDGYAAAIAADACVLAQGRPGQIIPITMPARPALYA